MNAQPNNSIELHNCQFIPSSLVPYYPDLIVVIGMPRSGTTYTHQVLRQLGLSYSGEVCFIVPVHRRLLLFGDLKNPKNLERLVRHIHRHTTLFQHGTIRKLNLGVEQIMEFINEPTYRGVIYGVLRTLGSSITPPAERLAYKNPADSLHIPLLAELLPSARFIHVVRDGRDVAKSLMQVPWGSKDYYAAGRTWTHFVSKARRDGQNLPGRYHEFRYEDLLTEPQPVLTGLVEYIFGEVIPEKVETLLAYIDRTKKSDRVLNWQQQLSERERSLFEAGAADTLHASGYQTEFKNASISLVEQAYHWGVDITWRTKTAVRRTIKSLSQ